MNKRYQVFVSSTYADLKEERSKVIQTIMELDCIPAGMEIFPAIDEEQFNFIKSIIDDCDYYLLIIGGRYGSVSEDGISYTEMEYDYALQKGIKVIAFIHENPDAIPLGKSEKDEVLRKKLDAFKNKVASNRLIKFWNNASELPGLVSLSLSKTIKTYPAIGWIRANSVTNPELLQELNEQRKENNELRETISVLNKQKNKTKIADDLASLSDKFTINGRIYFLGDGSYEWTATLTWGEIFYLISPYLLKPPSDNVALKTFGKIFFAKSKTFRDTSSSPDLNEQDFQTIKIHLKTLGLVDIEYSKTTNGGMDLFWSLTKEGEEKMMELRSVKKI